MDIDKFKRSQIMYIKLNLRKRDTKEFVHVGLWCKFVKQREQDLKKYEYK